MTVTELIEHAQRLEADLVHKRREIRNGDYGTYSRETLTRQCDALSARVQEIMTQCAAMDAVAEPVLAA